MKELTRMLVIREEYDEAVAKLPTLKRVRAIR